MSRGGSLARRWGYPAVGAVAVGVLVAVNLAGLDLTGRSRSEPDRPPATARPTFGPIRLATSGGSEGTGADDHFGTCRTGAAAWGITAVSSQVFTGLSTVTVPAGAGPDRPATVPASTVLRAGVTVTGAVTTTPEQVLIEAGHRIGTPLAAPGATTPTADRRIRLPEGRVDLTRRYVAWTGRTRWSGRWSLRWCQDGFWRASAGRWSSFSTIAAQGAVLCRLGTQDLGARAPDDSWAGQACRHG
ncbi:hypothetical protein FHX74_001917 [Friedmanniella endophytica]|uniref:Uncharacterized protein n=1 Tax=Microlunatus kandeliicorticis TaxID=1759536 RepID=A0A7W3ISB5_9ACTN|nr:hypothetical protein [Microlunatus kandeliicorticis]MBA8794298.1 hypothetical protein [Microlunatus kandeliicorticis]